MRRLTAGRPLNVAFMWPHCGVMSCWRSTARGEDAGDVDVLGRERQQGHVTGALQGDGEHALVPGARAGLATRLDLAAVGNVATQLARVLVIDLVDLVDAERTDAPATETAATATGTAPRTVIATSATTATTAAIGRAVA